MIKNILLTCSVIVFIAASPAFAQWGGAPGRRNSPVSDSPCWTKAYLEATPEQLGALQNLQRSFYKEISALKNTSMNKGYEIGSLLESQNPDAKMILEKQRQISDLKKNMDELSIQYLLKARALFTPEQLLRLPSRCNLGFNYGQGAGWGQGRSRNRF